MADRALDSVTATDAVNNGWEVAAGDPNTWETLVKVCNKQQKMMKSTKRMRVTGGFLYQVSTEGPKGYAEALTFVPAAPAELKPQKPIVRKPPGHLA